MQRWDMGPRAKANWNSVPLERDIFEPARVRKRTKSNELEVASVATWSSSMLSPLGHLMGIFLAPQ